MGRRVACVQRDGDGGTFFGRTVSLLDCGEASHLDLYRSSWSSGAAAAANRHIPVVEERTRRRPSRSSPRHRIGGRLTVADVATRHFGWPSPGFALVNVLVVAPLFEEVVFRGFFLRELQESHVAFWPANITAALMFLGLHLPGWYFVGRLRPHRQVWRSAFVSSGSSPDTPGGRPNRRGPPSPCTSSTICTRRLCTDAAALAAAPDAQSDPNLLVHVADFRLKAEATPSADFRLKAEATHMLPTSA